MGEEFQTVWDVIGVKDVPQVDKITFHKRTASWRTLSLR